MTTRIAILLLLAVISINGALTGYFFTNSEITNPIKYTIALIMLLIIYLWYYFDAKRVNYKRTVPMGAAVVLISIAALPFYLYRSRRIGFKAKALALYFGMCILMLAAQVFFFVLFRVIQDGK